MPNLNKVMLMGNLTRDPEIKYTPKGTAIAAFGLAVNRSYTLENGEKREEVTFVDCEAYARLAEIIGEYCKRTPALRRRPTQARFVGRQDKRAEAQQNESSRRNNAAPRQPRRRWRWRP